MTTKPQHRAGMFMDLADDPREGGPSLGDERATLTEVLRFQRLTLQIKCDGLDAARLARRAVEPSTMSLLGLVRHMAEVERTRSRRRFDSQDVPRRYQTSTEPDGDFDGVVRTRPSWTRPGPRGHDEVEFRRTVHARPRPRLHRTRQRRKAIAAAGVRRPTCGGRRAACELRAA